MILKHLYKCEAGYQNEEISTFFSNHMSKKNGDSSTTTKKKKKKEDNKIYGRTVPS